MSSLLVHAWATAGFALGALTLIPLVCGSWTTRALLVALTPTMGSLLTVGSCLVARDRARIREQNRRLETMHPWFSKARHVAGVGAFAGAAGQVRWFSSTVAEIVG